MVTSHAPAYECPAQRTRWCVRRLANELAPWVLLACTGCSDAGAEPLSEDAATPVQSSSDGGVSEAGYAPLDSRDGCQNPGWIERTIDWADFGLAELPAGWLTLCLPEPAVVEPLTPGGPTSLRAGSFLASLEPRLDHDDAVCLLAQQARARPAWSCEVAIGVTDGWPSAWRTCHVMTNNGGDNAYAETDEIQFWFWVAAGDVFLWLTTSAPNATFTTERLQQWTDVGGSARFSVVADSVQGSADVAAIEAGAAPQSCTRCGKLTTNDAGACVSSSQ